jgi:hypothetical protein
MTPKYDTINNGNILLFHEFPGGHGTRGGRLILVDLGDKYVVANQYHYDGDYDPEWGNGNYFEHRHSGQPQSRALFNALEKYRDKLARLKGNDGAV